MFTTLPARVVLTLLLALASALVFRWLRTPLPWMLGPLLVVAAASMLGLPTRSFSPFRDGAQATIATALGLYFTPQIAGLVISLWWAILLAIVWSVALGWVAGRWLHRVYASRIGGSAEQQRATTFFAGAIGGSSEMTVLAEREGGRGDLVAAAHTMRVILVALLVPFCFTLAGVHGVDATLPGPKTVQWGGLALLALAAGASSWIMLRTARANPWFMGPLLASMCLTIGGIELSAVPQWLTNCAQVLIGVSLGVRFSPSFVTAAPRWLGLVTLNTLGMILASVAMSWFIAWGTGLHWATLILGTAPGGIAEMAITAKVLQMGVPMVTAFQVCRVVAVMMLVEPLYRWGWLR